MLEKQRIHIIAFSLCLLALVISCSKVYASERVDFSNLAIEFDENVAEQDRKALEETIENIVFLFQTKDIEKLSNIYTGTNKKENSQKAEQLITMPREVYKTSIGMVMVKKSWRNVEVSIGLDVYVTRFGWKETKLILELAQTDNGFRIKTQGFEPAFETILPPEEAYYGKIAWKSRYSINSKFQRAIALVKDFINTVYRAEYNKQDYTFIEKNIRIGSLSEQAQLADMLFNLPGIVRNIEIQRTEISYVDGSHLQVQMRETLDVSGKKNDRIVKIAMSLAMDESEKWYIESISFSPNYTSFVTVDEKNYEKIKIQCEVSPELKDYIPKISEMANKAYNFFVGLWGNSPFEKIRIIENASLNTYRDGRILGTADMSVITLPPDIIKQESLAERVIAHEVSHLWWGGGQDAEEIWLVEGLARFSEWLYLDKFGEPEEMPSRLVRFQLGYAYPNMQEAFDDIKLVDLTYSRDPDGHILSTIGYGKGAYVFKMLRNELGDKDFFRVLREYYDENTVGGSQELESIVQRITGKDYEWFFDQWVYSAGYPHLSFNYKFYQEKNRNILEVKLQQRRDAYRLTLPVMVKTQSRVHTFQIDLKEKEQTWKFDLDGKPDLVTLDPDYLFLKFVEGCISDYLARASYFIEHQQFSIAKAILQNAIKLDPKLEIGNMMLARCYVETGDYKLAEEIYNRIINKNPKDVDAYLGLATIAEKCNDNTLALERYKKVFEIAPGNQEGRLGQARVALNARDYKGAIKQYTGLLNDDQGLAEARIGQVKALMLSGDIAAAEKEAERATAYADWMTDLMEAQLQLLLGHIYDLQGKREMAKDAYHSVLELTAEPSMEKAAKAGLEKRYRLEDEPITDPGIQYIVMESVQFYLDAWNKGDNSAASKIGFIYENGVGELQDYDKARQWYEDGAKAGDAKAQFNLAKMYGNGFGCSTDYAQAFKYFEMAAKQGEKEAQYNLGLLLEFGRGVSADKVKAYAWYTVAKEGCDWQLNPLISLRTDLLDETLNSSEIAEALKIAANISKENVKPKKDTKL